MKRSLDSRLDRIEASLSLQMESAEHEVDMERLRYRNFRHGCRRFGYDIDDPNIRQALIDNFKAKGWAREAQILESYTKDDLDG